MKADEILTNWTPPPVLLAHYPGGHFGYDKMGRPIWIEPIGRVDVKGKRILQVWWSVAYVLG